MTGRRTLEAVGQDFGRSASSRYWSEESAVHLIVGGTIVLLVSKAQTFDAPCVATSPAPGSLDASFFAQGAFLLQGATAGRGQGMRLRHGGVGSMDAPTGAAVDQSGSPLTWVEVVGMVWL